MSLSKWEKQIQDCLLVYTDQAKEQDRDWLHQQIKTYNDSVSAHHRAARQSGWKTLDFFLYDTQGQKLGGLTSSTYWGWLEIGDLWLSPMLRGRGLGKELVRSAESEAISRGCSRAWLQTFSFQARGFYEKLGYRVVGELQDYPPGRSFYWMRKDFNRA